MSQLDAHRDNDHRTRWVGWTAGDWVLLGVLAAVLVAGFAAVGWE